MTGYIDPRGKLFGHMDRLAELRTGRRPAPVNVEVDLSNRCNLGCHGCHFSHLHSRGPWARDEAEGYDSTGDLMDDDLLTRLPHLLKAWGARSVTWSGGGEPTMHPGFAGALFATAPVLAQGLYTNGTLINDGLAYAVRQTCEWVYVSLDYADAAEYGKWKGVDVWNAATLGIERLVAATGKATVGVGFLLGAHNWRDAPDMLDLARNLGADYAQFRPMIMHDPATPGKPAEDTSWIGYFLSSNMASALADEADVYLDLKRFAAYGNWDGHGYQDCWWCSVQTVVTPDGRAWLCVNRRGQPDACIGHVDDLQNWWQHKAAPVPVDGDCRLMCRGHVPNLELTNLMAHGPHEEFI